MCVSFRHGVAHMNPTLDRVDLAHGQALLSQLPDTYFAILKAARLEYTAESKVACKFEVPGIGKRTLLASSSAEAIRLALIDLTSLLTSRSFLNPDCSTNFNICSRTKEESDPERATERFQSKTRQLTVGVTLPSRLKEHLVTLADSQKTTFADVSRRFTVYGLEDFIDRSLFVSAKSLFELLENELRNWQGLDSEQVMLRLDPSHAVRVRSAAKEYNRSVSEFGALCMAHGLILQEELVLLGNKVARFKGAAIRPLLAQLELGAYAASLLSGVFIGNIRAPKTLIRKLSSILEAPEASLNTLFKRSFESRTVPSFKAKNGKPEVSKTAIPWSEAVQSLSLPSDQAQALLKLGE